MIAMNEGHLINWLMIRYVIVHVIIKGFSKGLIIQQTLSYVIRIIFDFYCRVSAFSLKNSTLERVLFLVKIILKITMQVEKN